MPHSVHRRLKAIAAAAFAALASACAAPPAAPPPEAAPPPAAKPLVADEVVVVKSQHLLKLLHRGKVFQTYDVSLGEHIRGTKQQAGDGRTPEGVYTIDWRSEHTPYTRELHISYPNAKDRAHAAAMNVSPGGGIFIHGLPRDYGPYDPPFRFHDWTNGCISVGNAAIVAIWDAVPDGTPIDIQP